MITDPPNVFYLRAKADFDIKHYRDLLGKSIGVNRDSSYFIRFDNDTDLRKAVLSEESKLIELLIKRRIDTFIGTASSIDYLLQECCFDRHLWVN